MMFTSLICSKEQIRLAMIKLSSYFIRKPSRKNNFLLFFERMISDSFRKCVNLIMGWQASKLPYDPDFEPISVEGLFFVESEKNADETNIDEEDYLEKMWHLIGRKTIVLKEELEQTFEDFLNDRPGNWDPVKKLVDHPHVCFAGRFQRNYS